MRIGVIELGRMGSKMVLRLIKGGHECVIYDVQAAAIKQVVRKGAVGASSLRKRR